MAARYERSVAGVRLESEAHVEQMVPPRFPHEGQLGQTGKAADRGAHCLSSFVVLSVREDG